MGTLLRTFKAQRNAAEVLHSQARVLLLSSQTPN